MYEFHFNLIIENNDLDRIKEIGIRDNCPYQKYDYVPCYHCTDSFNKLAPCKEVCYYNSITIKRY